MAWSPELAQRDEDARGKPLVALDRSGAVVHRWTPYRGMWRTHNGLASYAAVEAHCNYEGWTLHVVEEVRR